MTSVFKSAVIIIGMFLLASFVVAEDDGKIAFLKFKYDGEKVTLLDSKLVDGTIKEKRKEFDPAELRYDILDKDKRTLMYDAIDNPLEKKFDFEDPENPGQMKAKVVQVPEAEFTIRINYTDEIGFIRFTKYGKNPQKGGMVLKIIGEIPIENLAEKNDE